MYIEVSYVVTYISKVRAYFSKIIRDKEINLNELLE